MSPLFGRVATVFGVLLCSFAFGANTPRAHQTWGDALWSQTNFPSVSIIDVQVPTLNTHFPDNLLFDTEYIVASSHAAERVGIVTSTGDVSIWGNCADQACGVASTAPIDSPTFLATGTDVLVGIALADSTSFLLNDQGVIYSAGADTDGLRGRSGNAQPFTSIPSALNFTKIAAGRNAAGAVTVDGLLYTWGRGAEGQLGHGDNLNQVVPTLVEYLDNNGYVVEDVCFGQGYGLALTTTGALFSWGDDVDGCLGRDVGITADSTPGRITGFADEVIGLTFTQIACGDTGAGAVTDTGDLWTWGAPFTNASPTLGYYVPQNTNITDVASLSMSGDHGIAVIPGTLLDGDTVLSWGLSPSYATGFATLSAVAPPQALTLAEPTACLDRELAKTACGPTYCILTNIADQTGCGPADPVEDGADTVEDPTGGTEAESGLFAFLTETWWPTIIAGFVLFCCIGILLGLLVRGPTNPREPVASNKTSAKPNKRRAPGSGKSKGSSHSKASHGSKGLSSSGSRSSRGNRSKGSRGNRTAAGRQMSDKKKGSSRGSKASRGDRSKGSRRSGRGSRGSGRHGGSSRRPHRSQHPDKYNYDTIPMVDDDLISIGAQSAVTTHAENFGSTGLAEARYAYTARDSNELNLVQGQTVEILDTDASGWWLARDLETKKKGYIPCLYVNKQ